MDTNRVAIRFPDESVATTSTGHADGAALLAVAEGHSDSQPSDAVVAHIFGCPRCSDDLRDLRLGLGELGRPVVSLDSADAHDRSVESPFEADMKRRIRRLAALSIVLVIALVTGLVGLRLMAAGRH